MPPARRNGNSGKAAKSTPTAWCRPSSCHLFDLIFPRWRAFEACLGVQENMPVGLVSAESLGKGASQQR
jgi:hypothetical protein